MSHALIWFAVLATAPQETSPAYDAAVAARQRGDLVEAERALAALSAQQPENADIWLQIGLTQMAAGRNAEAEAALRRVLSLAPDYPDARIALARIEWRKGERDAALASLAPVAATGNAEARTLLAQIEGSPEPSPIAGWQINADLAYSFFDGPQPDWQDLYLNVRAPLSDRVTVGAAIEPSWRFSRFDLYAEGAVEVALSDAVSVNARLGGTTDADFRPKWQLGLGGRARLTGEQNATIATIDARQARFAGGDVQTLTPGVEQYLAGGQVWITAQWINLFDETGRHRAGWLARGDVLATDRLRLFAGYADAPDTSEGRTLDVRSVFAGVAYGLSDTLEVRGSFSREDRSMGADRNTVSVGLGWRF